MGGGGGGGVRGGGEGGWAKPKAALVLLCRPASANW